jgi:ribosomal-protein-alanine N-acetyltransferase
MGLKDIEAALDVERSAFSGNWPATAFERELTHNGAARYVVLEDRDGAAMLGFGGLWLMVDEAHIVTVAVRPGERGRGLGKLLVHGLVAVAVGHHMAVATLECRESNVVARKLYGAYGFYEVGLRKKYYSDNHEDAVIMTTEELGSEPYQARWARLGAELERRVPGVVWELPEEWPAIRERR